MSEDLKSHTMINRCDPTGRLILFSTHSHGAGKARRIGTVTTANARLAPRGAWHDTLSTQLRDFHSYCSKSARWCHFKAFLFLFFFLFWKSKRCIITGIKSQCIFFLEAKSRVLFPLFVQYCPLCLFIFQMEKGISFRDTIPTFPPEQRYV